jgi:hypothetical protein
VEIFLKEFVLAAVFAQEDSGVSWDQAVRRSSKLFEKIKWRNALRKMTEAFGPLDPMTTADGRDVLDVGKEIVPTRHNIVHGREEASPEHATLVYQWAEQIIRQLKLRFVVAGKHPLADAFRDMYVTAFEGYHGHPPPEFGGENGL